MGVDHEQLRGEAVDHWRRLGSRTFSVAIEDLVRAGACNSYNDVWATLMLYVDSLVEVDVPSSWFTPSRVAGWYAE